MADAVTTQTLIDNERIAVLKFTNISDGTGESAVTKVDVSTLMAPPGKTCSAVSIQKIHYVTSGMSIDILWDATTDVLAWHIPENQEGCHDFCCFGGITNNAGAGKTGDVQFTTTGHTAGDRYVIVLELAKAYT